MKITGRIPSLVYANDKGEIVDLPDMEMAGMSGFSPIRPHLSDLIPLPDGSELFTLPGRYPVGFAPKGRRPVILTEDPFNPGAEVNAVAAFIAPAHTSVLSAAYKKSSQDAPLLPLFAYTAVGWLDGRFWVAAFRSDTDVRQDSSQYDQKTVRAKTNRHLKKLPDNRLIQHLGKCCLTYGCPAARNYFLGRWEAPIPTSPVCNAACLGCISLQPSGCCPATQDRIAFVPTADEIVELAVPHILGAPKPVVSFGQGCEGEPLLQSKTIEKSILKIRRQTLGGTINLNSNSSMPDRIDRLAAAGLDSLRVSMNSAREDKYTLYYRPRGYSFDDVKDSIRVMKRRDKFVSLNYFILPGFTDDPDEMNAFFGLVEDFRPDMIQLRNLNMDPDWYLDAVQHKPSVKPIGIMNWLKKLKKSFPFLRFGYFNPYLGSV
ncbi:MAG: radical SAM protein [Nitrospirae bacterium]|nr:MAG: radical SAM protein [Nitrospirota bacterium]